jgi:hypothetical protein
LGTAEDRAGKNRAYSSMHVKEAVQTTLRKAEAEAVLTDKERVRGIPLPRSRPVQPAVTATFLVTPPAFLCRPSFQ